MNRPYSWTRTRALLLALRDAWRSRPRRRCTAVDWSMLPRALCVLDRKHDGLHEDEDGHTWVSRVAGGHVRVEPEVQYCPCGGDCHDRAVPCSFTCIIHRVKQRDGAR